MKNEWRIITGTAKEVEDKLNKLQEEFGLNMCFFGISTTNEQTTVIIQIPKV